MKRAGIVMVFMMLFSGFCKGQDPHKNVIILNKQRITVGDTLVFKDMTGLGAYQYAWYKGGLHAVARASGGQVGKRYFNVESNGEKYLIKKIDRNKQRATIISHGMVEKIIVDLKNGLTKEFEIL